MLETDVESMHDAPFWQGEDEHSFVSRQIVPLPEYPALHLHVCLPGPTCVQTDITIDVLVDLAQSFSAPVQELIGVSQCVPLLVESQVQVYLFTPCEHVAPLRHGLLAHSSTSTEQLLAVKPAAQLQAQ